MRKELKSQVLDEIKFEVTKVIGDQFHESLDQVMGQLGIQYLGKVKKEQRRELLVITKRIFDNKEGAEELHQQIKNIILKRMNQGMKIDLEQTNVVWEALTDLYKMHVEASDKNRVTYSSYDLLFGKEISPKIRELLWQAQLANEQNSKEFYKYDHQAKRVKLEEQMREQINQTLKTLELKFHTETVDNIMRLVQYLFRKHNKIITPPVYFLACNLANVFESYSEYKINALGGFFVSLLELADYYNTGFTDEQHIQMINQALNLVDAESVSLFNKAFQEKPKQVLKYFKEYVQSLGSIVSNTKTAKFVIDQLLIKPRNKFDIHLNFAMLIMLVTSDGDDQPKQLKQGKKSKPAPPPPSSSSIDPQSQPQIQPPPPPNKDLFEYLSKSRLIDVPAYAKVVNHIYDGIPLIDINFDGLSNDALKRKNQILKESAVRSLLNDNKQIKRKINPRTNTGRNMTQMSRDTARSKQQPKQYYGLISPIVNMDE